MSFHPITLDAKTWNESGPGRYIESTVAFGAPLNYIKISPGTRNAKTGQTSTAVSRILQKDVTIAGVVTRVEAVVTTSVQAHSAFTVVELDSMALNNSDFITTANLTRMLNGER